MTVTCNTPGGLPADAVSASFDLTFESPCNNSELTTITSTMQTNPDSNDYNGDLIEFTYVEFIISPDDCTASVTCNNVSPDIGESLPCQELDE